MKPDKGSIEKKRRTAPLPHASDRRIGVPGSRNQRVGSVGWRRFTVLEQCGRGLSRRPRAGTGAPV